MTGQHDQEPRLPGSGTAGMKERTFVFGPQDVTIRVGPQLHPDRVWVTIGLTPPGGIRLIVSETVTRQEAREIAQAFLEAADRDHHDRARP